MALPLSSPLLPQLAKTRADAARPATAGSTSRSGTASARSPSSTATRVELQSRNGKPLTRYFPELAFPAGRYVLDGEIVLFDAEGRQDFDALGQRIHPAASRVAMLAEQTPTRFIAFDLLALDDEVLLERPQAERRDRLAQLVEKPVDLTPCTEDPAEAEPWLQQRRGRDRQAPGRAATARASAWA